MAVFFDTHAHLDDAVFAGDLPQLIDRASAAGIQRIITIGTDLESSRRSVEISEQFPSVFAAVGWHPSSASAAPADVRPELRELLRHPKVVAIGEIGLDYYHLPGRQPGGDPAQDEPLKRRQAAVFRQQLELAAELSAPCIIHQRDSLDDILDQMQPFAASVRAVFHCFTADLSALRRVQALGSIVSFTGILSFKNAQSVRDALAATPDDQFMLETDSPYLAPVPHRGKRCEPAYVRHTAEKAAEVRGLTLEKLSEITCRTAHGFFPKLTAV